MDEVLTAADLSSTSTSSLAASAIQSPFTPLSANYPFVSALLACSIAQFLKLFTFWFKEKRWDSRSMLGSGGMPSSHSATVVALAVAIGLQEGTGGSLFALAIILASIVMYDASGIRLHAGRQAEVKILLKLLDHSSKELTPFVRNMQPWNRNVLMILDTQRGRFHLKLNCIKELELLNQLVCELPPEHPLSNGRPLRDSLGHTPLQVSAGAVLGCLVSYLLRNSSSI